ncbi:hypothetical protein CDIK_0403 [Cucumispora dikerogammari]|nr:hypothetical protein CDIK_0403 [Cucumispora dikerogammari]
MYIEITLETTPVVIKQDYNILIEYQGRQIQPTVNKYCFFIHTIHERLFETIIIKFNRKWWKITGENFFGEIKINELNEGRNYILIYPGTLFGKYLNYNHLKEEIGLSTINCKLRGARNAEILIEYTNEDTLSKRLPSFSAADKKKFLFFLYQTKQIFAGTNFCNINVLKGIYLLEKIFYNPIYLDSSRYKRCSYSQMSIEFITKYENLLYYAIAPYGKFITLQIPKRANVQIEKISEMRRRILEFLNIPDKSLIEVHIADFQPAHIVFKSDCILYISFRGTETLNEVSHDVYTKYATFKNGYIHEGIKDLGYAFYNRYKDKLISMKDEHNCRQIVFLGHSLGGALATMSGILFKPILKDLMVYTFAPVPFLSESIIKDLNCDDYIINIINGDDIFPRLSLGSLLDFKYITSSIGSNIKLHTNNKFHELTDYYHEIKNYLSSPHQRHMKLYFPGKMFHIKKFPFECAYLQGSSILKRINLIGYKSVVLFKEISSEFLNEIVVSAGFYYDHILQSFVDVFSIAKQYCTI